MFLVLYSLISIISWFPIVIIGAIALIDMFIRENIQHNTPVSSIKGESEVEAPKPIRVYCNYNEKTYGNLYMGGDNDKYVNVYENYGKSENVMYEDDDEFIDYDEEENEYEEDEYDENDLESLEDMLLLHELSDDDDMEYIHYNGWGEPPTYWDDDGDFSGGPFL